MTAEPIVIDAASTELPDALQGIARRYVDARKRVNEATLEVAQALYEARQVAQHGEWYVFLATTNTSEDFADRLLNIYTESKRSPQFAEVVERGWLPTSQAAIVARPSTPPEAKAAVLEKAKTNAESQKAPPSRREVERTVQESRSRTGAGSPSAPKTPIVLTPLTPAAPAGAPTVLATVSAGGALPPMLQLGAPAAAAPLPPALFAPAPAEPSAPAEAELTPQARLVAAEALVSLLEQALSLAESERGRVVREVGDAGIVAPVISFADDAVETAAETFVELPAVRAAAAALAATREDTT
jgi:hypothetical protein